MRKSLVVAAVALAMATAPAFARGQKSSAKAKPDQASSVKADQLFVTEAAKGGMAEVELGKLAAQKASSNEVKQFGQRMADDHGKANDELKSLAQSKNITLPATLDAKDKALQDRLSKLSGTAFDRAYIQAMLNDHRKDVSAFRRESQVGRDPEVKQWASKTLPTVEEHLKLAQDTSKTAVGTSGKQSRTPPPSAPETKGSSGTKNPATPDRTKGSSGTNAPSTPPPPDK